MRLLMRLARATTSITVALLAAAEVGAQSVVRHGPLLEAHIWGGYTTFAGADGLGATSRSVEGGLRSLELAIRPTHSLRVFGRYDNTLSLDNLALIRAGRRIPLYRAGAQVDWAGRFTTITHVSHRTLPGRIQQTMLGGEQVVFLPGGIAAKAGGWVGPRSDNLTEWLAHAGVNFAAGRSVRLEPTLFYTRSGIANEHQWRALLVGETRLGSRLTLGGGAARGQNTSIDTRLSGTASTEFVRLSASVAHAQTLHLLINHESAPGTQRLTTIAAGMSIGVPRR
jgi:hypothetical protein